MIVQTYMVILTLSVGLISDVTCASFSNVYVESDVVPMRYYSYGMPYPDIANLRLSQINSLPAVPGYVTVHPTHAVTHGNHNPNVVTYRAPSAPIVIAPKQQEPTGYEYSYVVYDQNTGDHKAQRELSDGSVVRGEYSFLQPDGYVREVQYVADDVSGFNAVVKKFLPVAVEGNKKGTTNAHKESPPCHEIKSESLKEGSEKIHEILHKTHSNEKVDDKSKKHTRHGTPKENNNHGKPKESQEEENSKENHHLKPEHSNEESGEKSKKHTQHSTSKENNSHSKPKESQEEENSKEKHHLKPEHSNEESDKKLKKNPQHNTSKENNDHSKSKESHEEKSSKEIQHIKPKHSKEETDEKSKENDHSKSKKISEENSSDESEEINHKKCKESTGKSKEKQHNKSKEESKESGEDSEEESESEESKEKYRKISSKETKESKEHNKEKTKKGSKVSSGEDSGEELEEVSHGKHKEVHELLKPSNGAALPYRDIIRCIEAAMRRNNGIPAAIRQEHSPLTYIVLNKPC